MQSISAWAAEGGSVQAQVLNTMKDLQKERGLTCLFMSHKLAVVRRVSDSVGVMYPGRLVELADKQTLFSTRAMLVRACCLMPFLKRTPPAGSGRRYKVRYTTR